MKHDAKDTGEPGREVGVERGVRPMMRHNLNWKIRYRETPRGKEEREAHYQRIGMMARELEVDANGYATSQMWEVMQLYGRAMRLGGAPPIELDVFIEADPGAANEWRLCR
jgi:hypothetical protein